MFESVDTPVGKEVRQDPVNKRSSCGGSQERARKIHHISIVSMCDFYTIYEQIWF